jgi:hypothetical protein
MSAPSTPPQQDRRGWRSNPLRLLAERENILGLYNAYNRVRTVAACRDSTASWTYNSTTWRAANASNSNRVTYVDGLQQSALSAFRSILLSDATSTNGLIGIDLDSTSNAPDNCSQLGPSLGILSVGDQFPPQLGLHFVQAVEAVSGGTTATFFGLQTTPTRQLNSMSLELEM